MDPSALAEAMADEFVASVPRHGDQKEWLAAALRIIAAAIEAD
jgi:hypothetical protein